MHTSPPSRRLFPLTPRAGHRLACAAFAALLCCSAADGAGAQSCDDQQQCTASDMCQAGMCIGMPVTCGDDGSVCTVERCDPGTGQCVVDVKDCDDLNPCTADHCDALAGCISEPLDGTDCRNLADECTAAATCSDGMCVRTAAADGTPCLAELPCVHACLHGLCAPTRVDDGAPCEDGFGLCTSDDVCTGGLCLGNFVRCDDDDPCTLDFCNPTSGACESLESAISCNDGLACTRDTCDPQLGCEHRPRQDGTGCDDGNDCTEDECRDGFCIGLAPGVDTPTPRPSATPSVTLTPPTRPRPRRRGRAR